MSDLKNEGFIFGIPGMVKTIRILLIILINIENQLENDMKNDL